MIPFIIIVGLAYGLGYVIAKPADKPRLKRGPVAELAAGPSPTASPFLDLFTRTIRAGMVADPWLVSETIMECFERGDVQMAYLLSESFSEAPVLDDPPSAAVVEKEEDGAPATSSSAPESRPFSSPLKGIPDEEWASFVESLRVADSSYDDEKYVGAFHLNKNRLRKLGLNPEGLSSEASQIEALTSDVMDHFEKHKEDIAPFIAQPIKIDGSDHVVSLSGMLGLLKAAGPKNAIHWIEHPEAREKFPHTKQLFLRCNNQF